MADSNRFSLPARPVLPPGSAPTRNRPILAKFRKPRQPHDDDCPGPSTTPNAPPLFPSNNNKIPSNTFRRGMSDLKSISSVPQRPSLQTSMRISKKQAKTRRLAYTLSEDLTDTAFVMKIKLMVLAAVPRKFLQQNLLINFYALRFAAMAYEDRGFLDLAKRVAANNANEQELGRFQRILDQILLEYRGRFGYRCG